MRDHNATIIPSLYIQNKGEQLSVKIALMMTTAVNHFVVRITGGCGYMSASDANGLCEIFVQAFQGFAGAMLFGGTRMVKKNNPQKIVPGITEIPPLIRQKCPNAKILGVVPKTQDLKLVPSVGIIISSEKGNDYITIIHPDQDNCLLLQESVDGCVLWDLEYQECLKIINNLREFANWNNLLISYNGGSVTEKEILAWAKFGWQVLLIDGSGRKSEEYARNKFFLDNNPSVHVAEKNSASIRSKLIELGAINPRLTERRNCRKKL